jgi:hypothetical protein
MLPSAPYELRELYSKFIVFISFLRSIWNTAVCVPFPGEYLRFLSLSLWSVPSVQGQSPDVTNYLIILIEF